MRYLSSLALVAAFLAPAASAQQDTVNAGRGPVPLYVPAGYDPAVPTPLVVLLHAFGLNGSSQESRFPLAPLVDTEGFLYLTPTGTQDATGMNFWNATDGCCNLHGSTVDDVGYLIQLLEQVKANYNVDGTRTYIVGHSNGGFMAHRMACEHPDRFAAIVSLAGATWDDPADCVHGAPVHVLQIHGTNDDAILYGGGTFPGGGPYPSAQETVEFWAMAGGCSLTRDPNPPPIDFDGGIAGNETTVTRYTSGCDPEGSAELWTVNGGGHTVTGNAQNTQMVIDWLLARQKPHGSVSNFCTSVPNSTGQSASMSWSGSVSMTANDLVLSASGVPALSSAVFIYSPDATSISLGNGTLCIGSQTLGFVARTFPVTSDGAGVASIAFDFYSNPSVSIFAGDTFYFSCWYRDLGAGRAFFNFADGLEIVVSP